MDRVPLIHQAMIDQKPVSNVDVLWLLAEVARLRRPATEQIRELATTLEAVKDASRDDALKACRRLEAKLAEIAGEGQRLQGLPNLGTGNTPWRGVNLRAEYSDERLPPPRGRALAGPYTLCLDAFGRIVYARVVADQGPAYVEQKYATDEELRAEDVVDVADAFTFAVGMHVEHCAASQGRYAEFLGISQRIAAILDGEPSEGVAGAVAG